MDEALQERVARVEAQLAIQQLAARYARAIDARDIEGLSSLYSPTCDYTRFGFSDRLGPEGVRAMFDSDGILTSFYRSMHQLCGHVIELDDADNAQGTVYCRVEHEDGDDWIIQLMVYFDRYRRVDGAWLFEERQMAYLHTGDPRQTPQEVGFNSWPGWDNSETMFAPKLPQLWPTWRPFWQRHAEFVSRRTGKP